MILVLLGAPGAGKGTLAKELVEKLGCEHVSTGDLFRYNIGHATAIGQEAKGYIDRGQLVPDEITNQMVEIKLGELIDSGKSFILDGYPRNFSQVKCLEKMLERLGAELDIVLELTIEDEIIIERIESRRVCSQCGHPYSLKMLSSDHPMVCDICGGKLIQRADDNRDTVKSRLDVYHESTAAISDYYRAKGILHCVDASKTPSEVLAAALKIIEG